MFVELIAGEFLKASRALDQTNLGSVRTWYTTNLAATHFGSGGARVCHEENDILKNVKLIQVERLGGRAFGQGGSGIGNHDKVVFLFSHDNIYIRKI